MANFERLQFLSLNIRGIGDNTKRREVFRWLKRYHKGGDSIVMLQETHSTPQCELVWEREWGSKIYFSHGANNARGVAILMPLRYNFTVTELWKDTTGRAIALTLTMDDKTYNIVNIYAPTKDKLSEQVDFLRALDLNLQLAETPFILAGDFNTYLDPILDKQGGKAEGRSKYADQLITLLNEYNIVDVWRILNPSCKRYTWRQNHPLIQSRLDYFFIAGELFYNLSEAQIKPSIKTDHSILTITLNLNDEQKRGPGFWKFNSALLSDEVYIGLIRELCNTLRQQYEGIQDHGLKWDVIKSELRQQTIDYSKTQAKIRRMVENDLNTQYLKAAEEFEADNSTNNMEQLEYIKEQIEEINAYKSAGAHIRSKAVHVEENERSTTYFLNVEKRNYKMKQIKKLNISETETVCEPEKILKEELKFYKNLYTNNKSVNSHNDKIFFNNIPTLNEEDKNLCDQDISLEECAKALLTLKNGKSPGSDGFPPEFYKMFWKNISTLVYDSLIYAINNNHLSIEQRRGILKLILKKDKNPCFLKNWRPISLLNMDYKLLLGYKECFLIS